MSDDASKPAKGSEPVGAAGFERKPAELMQAINVSIGFDQRLGG